MGSKGWLATCEAKPSPCSVWCLCRRGVSENSCVVPFARTCVLFCGQTAHCPDDAGRNSSCFASDTFPSRPTHVDFSIFSSFRIASSAWVGAKRLGMRQNIDDSAASGWLMTSARGEIASKQPLLAMSKRRVLSLHSNRAMPRNMALVGNEMCVWRSSSIAQRERWAARRGFPHRTHVDPRSRSAA